VADLIVKLRHKHLGAHVHVQVFVGEREGNLALSGELTFREGEWDTFKTALIRADMFVLRDLGVTALIEESP
jgi:hypothetical protein